MQKLPIGISSFSELRKKNCVYIDKTSYVYSFMHTHTRIFLSRPRRFGKSLLVSTLLAALQGKKELFQGLWIEKSSHDWVPYGVIRMDFSALDSKTPSILEQSLINALVQTAISYDLSIKKDFLGVKDALETVTQALYAKFGKVALLIDEYDYPILHALHSRELAISLREVIKEFSTGAKAQQEKISVVFVTGVSAFSKAGLSSGLNNLDNLTMNEEFFSVCGYTEEEVDGYFKEQIEQWALIRNSSYEEIRHQLKTWYNGYCFVANKPSIYNPFSLTCAFHVKAFRNFWFESASPQVLLDELFKEQRKQECRILYLDQLKGSCDVLQTFEVERIPLPALLFQMGYLTIKSYDPLTDNYFLKYPNREVQASFQKHVLALLTYRSAEEINPLMGDLYGFLVQENVEQAMSILTRILQEIPYPLHSDSEKFYHALLHAIFSASGVDVQSERMMQSGRMDLFLELPHLLYVIELKINQSPQKGLDQIVARGYFEPFLHKGKKILAIGLALSKKKKEKVDLTFVVRVIEP